MDPIEELKSFFEWVNSQPDSTPFKSIKLATTQYLTKLAKLESFIASKSSKEYDNFNEILQELSGKNQQLSSNLTQIEAELEEKSENLSKLQRKIQQLAFELAEKEAELDCKQMEKIRNADEKRKIVELLSEIESKSYEILVLTTENQGLSSGLKQAQSSNLAYIEAIEDLKQKLKMMRLKDGKSHENTLRRRNSSGIPLESLISEGSDSGKKPFPVKKHLGRPKRSPGNQLINKDFLAFTSCLASAVEALINQDGN